MIDAGRPVATSQCCALCFHPGSLGGRFKLNGYEVCRKCCYRFANRRQMAFILDFVLVILVIAGVLMRLIITLFWAHATAPSTGQVANAYAISLLVVQVMTVMLMGLKDGFRGQSPGKWLLGLEVILRGDYQPIGFGRSLLRNLPVMLLVALPLLAEMVPVQWAVLLPIVTIVGLMIIGFRLQGGSRWGDGLAGTRVIWKKYRQRLPFDDRGLHCVHCGYDLTGNESGVCPECGQAVRASSSGGHASTGF